MVKRNTIENIQTVMPNAILPYFDYDEIVYYYNNISDSAVEILLDSQLKNRIDSLKYGVILGSIPKDIKSIYFLENIESIGYKRDIISESKFPEITKIFSEKEVGDAIATKCLDIFRDILVFKKSNKIVGIAKICFSCKAYRIYGTSANTENFGQNGDYEKLQTILRK